MSRKSLINLAGVCCELADRIVEEELRAALIMPAHNEADGEVHTTFRGVKFGRRFERRWRYWSVTGMADHVLSYEYAKVLHGMYGMECRVGGDCGCPEPEENVMSYHIDTQDGLIALSLALIAEMQGWGPKRLDAALRVLKDGIGFAVLKLIAFGLGSEG